MKGSKPSRTRPTLTLPKENQDASPPSSPPVRAKRAATVEAPLWVRAVVMIVEVVVWALTLGHVKRVPVLEQVLGFSPRWSRRDRAAKRIRGALWSGVGAARRLAKPLLHIESEFAQDTVRDSADSLTPRTMTAYEETLKTRLQVNARIRSCLRDVSLEELEAPFLVNACTWNVDQQPPPVNEEAFMSWLLGQQLTEEVKHYQEHKQRVMARGEAVAPAMPSSATSTMRARKQSVAAGTCSTGSFALDPSSPISVVTTQASEDPLQAEWQWLEGKFPDLFLISLQEVEMTGAALVRESTQRRWEWTDAIIETLLAASDRTIEYKKVQVVQLVGLVLIVLVQAKHYDYVSHVRLSLTRTGALSVLGNKGSVAMRATIYGKRFLFISAHFVAHTYNEKKRMSNYQAALKDIRFEMPAWSDDESEVLQTFMNAVRGADQAVHNFSVAENSSWDRLFRFRNTAFRPSFSTAAEVRVLDEHDYVFFLGDLNSRLHAVPGPEIRESVAHREYDYLLCHDELRQLMVSGEGFDGFEEQWISFPPTYKFDPGTDVYDTSRKRRDPAWCDRVLFRVLKNDEAAAQQDGTATPDDDDGEGEETSPLPSRRPSPKSLSTSEASAASSLLREPSMGGDWVTLEELQRSQLEQQRAVEEDAELSSSTASSSSDYASNEHSNASPSPREKEHAAAAVAAQAGYDSPGMLRHTRQPTTNAFSRATSHAVWEHKPCAATFCARRRSHGGGPSSTNPFAQRFPMVTNHVNAVEYTHVPTLRQSDHRPVRARFEVKVVALEPATVNSIVESVREVIGG